MVNVSVITPFYNCVNYLRDTVEAIVSQTYTDWELILVDDCSSDGSSALAVQLSNMDDRVFYLKLDKNSGPAIARNKGIDVANGRYISFCDSDDVWLPDKLDKQLEAFSQSNASICFTSYYKMLENSVKTKRIVHAEPLVNYDMMLRSNYIGCSTAMYDTYMCGKVFMPDVVKRQDYGLWLKIMSEGHAAIGIQDPLVYYRVRSNSVSSNKLKAAIYHWKVLRASVDVSLIYAVWLFINYAWIGVRKRNI